MERCLCNGRASLRPSVSLSVFHIDRLNTELLYKVFLALAALVGNKPLLI